MDNLNWRAVLSMCMKHDPESRFPGSECKHIEGFGFYGNFKIPKRQFARGGNKKCRFQAAHAIFEAPEDPNTTVYLT
jgi:hypothetical protein